MYELWDDDKGVMLIMPFRTVHEARARAHKDKMRGYTIYNAVTGDREEQAVGHDPENIYGLASIRQSIEEDRK